MVDAVRDHPIPVEGAEGRYFWDYDGKRYLDFASQLVNVNIGHQHTDHRRDQGAGRQARGDRAADGERVALSARAAARGGHTRRMTVPRLVVLALAAASS
ncbi:MAG TPA: aminotransferase class III-fold pyridoxal phosphate-dependent enzyme [Gaiellaceae bacterium]|nr:aminotransferase class III-fold pyridoxal phosphate-dependent enzyme [Gaiellaceae bacterium]